MCWVICYGCLCAELAVSIHGPDCFSLELHEFLCKHRPQTCWRSALGRSQWLAGSYQHNGLGGAVYFHSICHFLHRHMTEELLFMTLSPKHSLTFPLAWNEGKKNSPQWHIWICSMTIDVQGYNDPLKLHGYFFLWHAYYLLSDGTRFHWCIWLNESFEHEIQSVHHSIKVTVICYPWT